MSEVPLSANCGMFSAGPGHYMSWLLPADASVGFPWKPHPTALADPALYWRLVVIAYRGSSLIRNNPPRRTLQ